MLRIQQFNQHPWHKWRWAEMGCSFPPLLPLSTCHTSSVLCSQSPFLTNKEKYYLPYSLHRDGLHRWCSGLKTLPPQSGDAGSIPGSGDPLEEEMVIHCSILAWKIPWTEEPGGLQSMESQRVVRDWACMHVSSTVILNWRRGGCEDEEDAFFSALEPGSETTTRNSAFSKPESDFCSSQISPKWGRASIIENMPFTIIMEKSFLFLAPFSSNGTGR